MKNKQNETVGQEFGRHNLPPILANPENFRKLKNRGEPNFRQKLYERVKEELSPNRSLSFQTVKNYYNYPSGYGNNGNATHFLPNDHGQIAILEDCLVRTLQEQAEWYANTGAEYAHLYNEIITIIRAHYEG